MLDRDILHPCEVLQIADMSQFIDRILRDWESLSKHSRRIGDCRAHKSTLTHIRNPPTGRGQATSHGERGGATLATHFRAYYVPMLTL
jgi:hypothetical protein